MFVGAHVGERVADMTACMELRRTHWAAAFKLAAVVSAVAVAIALAVSAFGDVSQTAVVIGVIVVGFVISWVQTGRTPRNERDPWSGRALGLSGDSATTAARAGRVRRDHHDHSSHRVATVRVHH